MSAKRGPCRHESSGFNLPSTAQRDDGCVEIDESAAVEALSAQVGPLPAGHRIRATAVPGSSLWWAGPIDENDMPYPGAGFLVGPDAQVWTVSSNPGIHDDGLAVEMLDATYREGLQDYLDAREFSNRLQVMTADRRAALRAFLADVRGGDMRERSGRRLP
jgi:hypothetical protein